MSEIESKVKAIIVDKLGVDESEVKAEASFTNDLGADSLDTVELIMEFEITIDRKHIDEPSIFPENYWDIMLKTPTASATKLPTRSVVVSTPTSQVSCWWPSRRCMAGFASSARSSCCSCYSMTCSQSARP